MEPSEGDSIFNLEKDLRKKAKMQAKLGQVPRESFYVSKAEVESLRSSAPVYQQM